MLEYLKSRNCCNKKNKRPICYMGRLCKYGRSVGVKKTELICIFGQNKRNDPQQKR